MRKLTKKRLKHQKMLQMEKNPDADRTPPYGDSSSSDSDSDSSSKNKNQSEEDSDLSDDANNQNHGTQGTAFDDYEMKSLDDKQY